MEPVPNIDNIMYTQIKRNDEESTKIENGRRTGYYKNLVVQNFGVLIIILKLSVILKEFYIPIMMIYGPKNLSVGTIFLDIPMFICIKNLPFVFQIMKKVSYIERFKIPGLHDSHIPPIVTPVESLNKLQKKYLFCTDWNITAYYHKINIPTEVVKLLLHYYLIIRVHLFSH